MKRALHHDRRNNIHQMKRFVSAQRTREQVQELAYLQSSELVTPCRLFIVLIGSVLLVLLISLSIGSEQITYSEDLNTFYVNLTKEPYRMNYKSVQNAREEMLMHYGYSAPDKKIEKRSGLSLQEFWDLYDGKW